MIDIIAIVLVIIVFVALIYVFHDSNKCYMKHLEEHCCFICDKTWKSHDGMYTCFIMTHLSEIELIFGYHVLICDDCYIKSAVATNDFVQIMRMDELKKRLKCYKCNKYNAHVCWSEVIKDYYCINCSCEACYKVLCESYFESKCGGEGCDKLHKFCSKECIAKIPIVANTNIFRGAHMMIRELEKEYLKECDLIK